MCWNVATPEPCADEPLSLFLPPARHLDLKFPPSPRLPTPSCTSLLHLPRQPPTRNRLLVCIWNLCRSTRGSVSVPGLPLRRCVKSPPFEPRATSASSTSPRPPPFSNPRQSDPSPDGNLKRLTPQEGRHRCQAGILPKEEKVRARTTGYVHPRARYGPQPCQGADSYSLLSRLLQPLPPRLVLSESTPSESEVETVRPLFRLLP